jgi:hypothetical protein
MQANAIALSALLLGGGLLAASNAQAVTACLPFGTADESTHAAVGRADALIQLADGGKLADKYMAGKAGGAKGIGSDKSKKDGKK